MQTAKEFVTRMQNAVKAYKQQLLPPVEVEKETVLEATDAEVEKYISIQSNLLNGQLRGWFDDRQKKENGDSISYVMHTLAERFFQMGQKHQMDHMQ
jgi:hypothetical protein